MHALVQDGDDADVPIGQAAPIDEMPFLPEKVPVYTELRWYRVR